MQVVRPQTNARPMPASYPPRPGALLLPLLLARGLLGCGTPSTLPPKPLDDPLKALRLELLPEAGAACGDTFTSDHSFLYRDCIVSDVSLVTTPLIGRFLLTDDGRTMLVSRYWRGFNLDTDSAFTERSRYLTVVFGRPSTCAEPRALLWRSKHWHALLRIMYGGSDDHASNDIALVVQWRHWSPLSCPRS